jgi:uncharacterized protein
MQSSIHVKNDLSQLYENADQAAFLQPQAFVEGAILGAGACPEIPLPDVWLPWVIKEHGQIKDAAQADAITDLLFAHFKMCLAQMHDESLKVPSYAIYSDPSIQENDNEALSQWCEGLVMAHSAMEPCWQKAWNLMQKQKPDLAPEMAKNLKHCLLMFSTFADPEKAIKEAAKKGDFTLAQNLPLVSQSLQHTLATYIELSGELAAYLPNQFETFKQEK